VADGRRRPHVVDLALLLMFAIYALGALVVLAQGLLAVAASISADLHETLHIEGLGTGPFSRVALRAADASHGLPSAPQIVVDYVFSFVHIALAGLLLWLRPRDWTARLLVVALIGAAGVFNLTAQAVIEQLPLFPIENFLQAGAHVVTGLAYVYALLLFPDGRPVPRWRTVPLVALYLPATLAAVFLSVRVEGPARPAALLLFFGLVVPAAGAAAQAYRIRRTDNVTGQAQARLLFWALLPSVALGIVFLATNGLAPTTNVFVGRHIPEPPVALYRAFEPAFALIPLALFAGLLRFRLWDIERLANRTVVYAGATTLLGGIYVTFVLVTQFALGSVAASPLIDSKPAVAITTLLLASAFRPVRARVQTFVDRRFNRSRYNAQLTVAEFAASLSDEVELENIAAQLGRVVHEVVEPHHLSLWVIDGTSTARTTRPSPTETLPA
jgi:hypothetical protein